MMAACAAAIVKELRRLRLRRSRFAFALRVAWLGPNATRRRWASTLNLVSLASFRFGGRGSCSLRERGQ